MGQYCCKSKRGQSKSHGEHDFLKPEKKEEEQKVIEVKDYIFIFKMET